MAVLLFFILSAAVAAFYGWKASGVRKFSDIWKPLVLMAALFLAFNVLYIFGVALISLFFKRGKSLKKQSGLCRNLVFLTSGIICTYSGVRMHITGEEKIPENDRFLFVCNHLSGFDPITFLAAMHKYNVSFISKPSNLKNNIVGSIAEAAGFLTIDRENNREALKTIIKASDYIQKGICSIGIYPEGTRSKTGELGEFHSGSFKIATKAHAPVVIACVRGTDAIKKNIFRMKSDVYLDILNVIPTDKVDDMSTSELSQYSRDLILSHQKECIN